MAVPVAVVLLGLLCLSGLDAEHRECPLLLFSSAGSSSPALALSRHHPGSPSALFGHGTGRGGGGAGGAVWVPSFSASRGGGWVGVPGETTGTPGGRVARDKVSACG